MHATNIKEAAFRLVDQLPDDATWDDRCARRMSSKRLKSGWPIVKPVG